MPKLLWVALPLIVFAVLAGAQALGKRPLSRMALNVWASVLLLVYVLATASLGVFWVANQQLPVFDWHYLFGYCTVLLVALHLVFNFPAVWRYFTRSGSRSRPLSLPVADSDGAFARRGVLGGIAVLLGAGFAFALGMRQGRSDLRIDISAPAGPGGASADPAAAALALVEAFHAFSSHSRAGVLLRAPGTDWGDPPPPFKRYPGASRLPLPAPGSEAGGMASGAAAEGGTVAGASLDLAALGSVLWHTSGVTETRGTLKLRASPSSGALFSTELYVVAKSVTGLASGLWHYDAERHALQRLPDRSGLDSVAAASLAPGGDVAACIVATAVFGRTGHKYRDRTYRYVLADLGHALDNLRGAAAAAGVAARFLAAFAEAPVAAALALDESKEGVLALVELPRAGPSPASASSLPPMTRAAPQPTSSAGVQPMAEPQPMSQPMPQHMAQPILQPMPAAVVAQVAPAGITAGVHAATSLRMPRIPSAAAASGVRAAASAEAQAVGLPNVAPVPGDVLGVIAARRSVRRFATRPIPLEALAGVLLAMTARVRPVWSDALRIDVVVHAVAGIEPGAYRYQPSRHQLLPRRVGSSLRDEARAAALDQDVIGDAAAVFIISVDRAAFAADPLGPARGYRHAFLETGLFGERVYLEAGRRGLGACGVGAFYDAEASALVAVDPAREWVLHFAALGALPADGGPA